MTLSLKELEINFRLFLCTNRASPAATLLSARFGAVTQQGNPAFGPWWQLQIPG
jgi:hypothetical protein